MTPLIDLLLASQFRGLALLLIAFTLARLLRRRSPAFESIIWRGAFAGLLAIPLLTSLAPPVTLPQKATTDFLATLESARQHYTVTYLDGRMQSTESIPEATPTNSLRSPAQGGRRASGPASDHPQPRTPTAHPHPAPLPNIVLSIWIAGAAAMLLRLFTAFLLRANLLRRSNPLQNNSSKNTIAQLRRDLGIRPPVRLRLHPDLPSPLSWGILRPTILLPADATDWDEHTLRLVLSHELSHFTHRDAVYRLLSELALVAYWINPLAWIALRRARLAEEQATDLAVLSRGENPARYAGLLLNFARRATDPATPLLSSPMAQPSTVAARLEAVLKPGTRFVPPPRRTRLLCAAAIVAIAITTGGLAFQARSATEESKSTGQHLLYTQVIKISPSVFDQKNATPADILWKSRGVTPAPGASAVYNQSTSRLIIRTTRADLTALENSLFKEWHQEETILDTYSGIGVVLFELRTPDANQLENDFANASDASDALKSIRILASASPPTVRLVGSLHMPPNLNNSRRSRIGISTGKDKWNNRVDLETKVTTTNRPHQLQVSLAASIGASSPALSITTILKPDVPRLAGFLDAKDGTTRTAVFLTLGRN